VIERGCDVTKSGEGSLGCMVDGTANSNFRSITCYCDTARCNGLSVEALVGKRLPLLFLSSHDQNNAKGVSNYTLPLHDLNRRATGASSSPVTRLQLRLDFDSTGGY